MFPFIDVKTDAIQLLSGTIERVLRIKESIGASLACEIKGNTLDAVSTALNFLRQQRFRFDDKEFIDCFGNGGEACLYAQVFGFKGLLSVEINSATYERGMRLMNELPAEAPGSSSHRGRISIKIGSFLDDYDSADFDCLFLDATSLRSSMLDEAYLINHFLQFSQHTLHGSYIVLVTVTKTVKLSDYLESANEMFVKLMEFPIGDETSGKAALYIYQKR